MESNPRMQQPTCKNVRIRSTNDAHKIFTAIQRGMLKMVTRRLDAEERQALEPGCVYAWEERGPHTEVTGLGIERFTEGRRWSPSRVRDEFLFYYEKYTPRVENGQSSTASDKHPPRDWDPLVKQTYSVWVETSKGKRKWHLTAYFNQTTVDSLGTIDDIPSMKDLAVQDDMFSSTRMSKNRSGKSANDGPSSKQQAQSSTTTQIKRSSDSPQPAQEQVGDVQMYQPYPQQTHTRSDYSSYHTQENDPSYASPSQRGQYAQSGYRDERAALYPSTQYSNQSDVRSTSAARAYSSQSESIPPAGMSPTGYSHASYAPHYDYPPDHRQPRSAEAAAGYGATEWYDRSVPSTVPQTVPPYPQQQQQQPYSRPSSSEATFATRPPVVYSQQPRPSETYSPTNPSQLYGVTTNSNSPPIAHQHYPQYGSNTASTLVGAMTTSHVHISPPPSTHEEVIGPNDVTSPLMAPILPNRQSQPYCSNLPPVQISYPTPEFVPVPAPSPVSILPPLNSIRRTQPYRRDPVDDKALRLLDPRPAVIQVPSGHSSFSKSSLV